MRILVISDSHNYVLDSQIDVIKKHGSFNMLIHCGDKYRDAKKFANKLNIKKIVQVLGNCDNSSDKPATVIEDIEGKKLLITHGHLHNVKSNLDELIMHAKEIKADAAIYGHTHCAQNEIIDNILIFNPGSSIMPKCGKESFGILDIKQDEINSEIISLED